MSNVITIHDARELIKLGMDDRKHKYMSKLNNLKASVILACFKNEVTEKHFPKLCADIDSNLGRLEKDIVTKAGEWKVGAKGTLVSKDGHKLQLPLNAPWATLVRFGLQLNALASAGSSLEPVYAMQIDANLPAECENWFSTNYRNKSVVQAVTT